MAKHTNRSANSEKEEETDLTGIIKEENKGNGFGGVPEALKFDVLRGRLQSGLHIFWKNKRLRWGMISLLVFAPMAKFVYLLLPEAGFGEYLINVGSIQIPNTLEGEKYDWYWGYIQQYVFSNGELLAPTISIFGLFLLFPKKYPPAYLAGLPFGYYLSMLIHRMFFVDSNENFLDGFSITITIAYLLLGIAFFIVSSKLLSRKENIKQAIVARIAGVIKLDGVSWEDKESILNKEVDMMIDTENELFTKKSA